MKVKVVKMHTRKMHTRVKDIQIYYFLTEKLISSVNNGKQQIPIYSFNGGQPTKDKSCDTVLYWVACPMKHCNYELLHS
jgi:hypothetical protein